MLTRAAACCLSRQCRIFLFTYLHSGGSTSQVRCFQHAPVLLQFKAVAHLLVMWGSLCQLLPFLG